MIKNQYGKCYQYGKATITQRIRYLFYNWNKKGYIRIGIPIPSYMDNHEEER